MMIFIESPWPILFIGIAVEAVLALALLHTGLGKFLWAMIGVAALVLVGLLVEHFVITDRKAVIQTLDAAVKAAKNNDPKGLLDCISPSAKEARDCCRSVLDQFDIQDAHISDLDIKVSRLTSPPTATAKFLAVGRARDRKGEMLYPGFAQHVTVALRLEHGRWLAADCTVEGLDPSRL